MKRFSSAMLFILACCAGSALAAPLSPSASSAAPSCSHEVDVRNFKDAAHPFGNLSTAKASPDTANKTIVIASGTVSVNDLTIPANRGLKVLPGAVIDRAGGKTLIVNGPFAAAGNPFAGNGTIVVGTIPASIDGQYYRNGQVVPGVTQDLPAATSSVVYNSYDNPPVNNDRNFNFVSQMWSGVTPTASPTNNKSNIALAGSFTAHRGGASGTFLTALNPMISWAAPPSGAVNTNDTTVTWLSGSKFLTGSGWQNATIDIGGVLYSVASVESDIRLTLKTSAGIRRAANFRVGGGIGVEIDINAGADDPARGLGATALAVASGGRSADGNSGEPHHVQNGITVSGAFGDRSAFRNAIVLGTFTDHGIVSGGGSAAFPNASAVDVTNGAMGSSFIRGGNPTLTLADAPKGLLYLHPSSDEEEVITYASNKAANKITHAVWNSGTANYTKLTIGGSIPRSNNASNINIQGVANYANNVEAIAAGLGVGDVYRNGDQLMIVH